MSHRQSRMVVRHWADGGAISSMLFLLPLNVTWPELCRVNTSLWFIPRKIDSVDLSVTLHVLLCVITVLTCNRFGHPWLRHAASTADSSSDQLSVPSILCLVIFIILVWNSSTWHAEFSVRCPCTLRILLNDYSSCWSSVIASFICDSWGHYCFVDVMSSKVLSASVFVWDSTPHHTDQ